MAASRITVDITGNSTELQAATRRAAESLKGLGDVLARQTDMSLAAGDKTVRMNSLVAKSFENVARVAASSTREASVAYTRATDKTIVDSDRSVAAMEKQARAAQLSADQQIRSNDLAASRMQRAEQTKQRAFGATNSAITRMGKGITIGLLGAAAASLDLAVKFQANTTRLQTQAGATERQVDKLRQGMLRMASEVGFTPNQLADGMYHVVSSMNAVLPRAQRVSGELKILAASAKLAQVGHANLEQTTYALASAMNALHEPLSNIGKVTGQLNAITGAGDMTMQDLIDTFTSGLLPAARTAGLSLQSVGAALAVMGDMGMRGALAGTRLRMSIALLSSPSEAAAKVLKTLGLSAKDATSTSAAMAAALKKAGLQTTQLGADMRKPDGFMVALRDLNQHLRASGLTATGAAAVMNKAFGGGRMGATITLLANSTDRLNTKFDQIGATGKRFGADWHATTQTLAFQFHSLESGAAALGVQIGSALIPVASTAIKDFREVVHWFEQGSTAAHALELAIGTLATVAIGSYLVSKLGSAIKLMREFGTVVSGPAGALQRFGASTRPGGFAGSLGGGMGSISGVRGFAAPGSPTNPIVVAIEGGRYTGLGGMAASEAGAAAGAESAAAGGILSRLKSGLGTVASRGLQGLTIAGLGISASQIAQQMIGGKTGKTIGSFGTAIAGGAGIGAILGPGGALAGAIGGALGEGIVKVFGIGGHGEDAMTKAALRFGQNAANDVLSHLPKAIDQSFNKSLSHQFAQANFFSREAAQSQQHAANSTVFSLNGPVKSRADLINAGGFRMQAAQEYILAGQTAAKAFIAGFDGIKYKSSGSFLQSVFAQLSTLPRTARNEAGLVAIQYAAGLEAKGQLPKGSLQKILTGMERLLPGFRSFLKANGMGSAQDLADSFRLSQAQQNLQGAINRIQSDFGGMQGSTKVTVDNMTQEFQAGTLALEQAAKQNVGQARVQALRELSQLRDQWRTHLSDMADSTATYMASIHGSIKTGSAASATDAGLAFGRLYGQIHAAMGAGAETSSQGFRMIAEATNQLLSSFGVAKIPLPALIQSQQLQSLFSQGKTGIAGVLTGSATGGFIGAPGEKGPDAVPVVVGRGEAILNYQQQAIVNGALAATGQGSLGHVFANTAGSKHYMASGGYAGYSLPLPRSSMMPGSWSIDQGVDIPAGANTPEFAIGPGKITTEGISGFGPNAPVLQITAGPLAGRSIYYGHAGPDLVGLGSTVHAGQQISEVGSGIVGISSGPHIEIGFYPPGGMGAGSSMAALLQQLLGGAGVTGVGGAGGLASSLKAPGVRGSGVVASLVRAALKKATGAANTYIGSHMPSSGPAGVSGSASAPSGSPAQARAWTAQAMKIAGVSGSLWEDMLLRQELRESSYSPTSINRTDINAQRGDPSEGILQTTLSTFAQYHLAGHDQILNPVDNIVAAIRYMIARYGGGNPTTAAQVMWARGGGAYAGGGFAGDSTHRKAKLPKTAHQMAKGLGPKDLRELSGAGGKIGRFESDLTTKLGQYSSMSTRFGVEEQSPQYLNADGSVNAAGIAKAKADDTVLLGLAQHILGDYKAELPIVSGTLRKFLGKQAKTEGTIAADERKLNANKIKEASIRTAILDLGKPSADQVGAIGRAIKATRLKYGGAVSSAEHAKAHYHGKDKGIKARLAQAVTDARQAEHDAVTPLEGALISAQGARSAHALSVRQRKFHLHQQLNGLVGEDTKLRINESKLKGILSGANGQQGTNATIGALETVAAKLGTVQWGAGGVFAGIDTTNQGAAYDEQTTIDQLVNSLGTLNGENAGSGPDQTALNQLLQQQNQQLATALALNESQTLALQSMIPEIPQYKDGGPIVRDGLIYAHAGEYVVPASGAPIGGAMQTPQSVLIEQHYHGSAGDLMRLVDQRIAHDGNVRVVSRKIGQRTSLLSGAPGR